MHDDDTTASTSASENNQSTKTVQSQTAWVAGSDAPEIPLVNLGFMALTDSAPLIVAATQGFAQAQGLTLELHRQPSWSTLRDKLATGELDAAQNLYGLVYAMHLGLSGGSATPMAVLMNLNHNGQAITLSKRLLDAGVHDGASLAAYIRQHPPLRLAQTFPTGTHALWLNFYLGSLGIDPRRDVESVVIPPAQMVDYLARGDIDGFCAGEPWGAHAIAEQAGFTLITSQQIWPDHPEKVLSARAEFVAAYPNTTRALMRAVLEASRFIELNQDNREDTAALISGQDYVGASTSAITPRFLGRYEDGQGHAWQDAHALRFFADGHVNVPYLSDASWFLSQFRRWGLLTATPDYQQIVSDVQRLDLFQQVATQVGLSLPHSAQRQSTLCDGQIWDGQNPEHYAQSFAIGIEAH
ncbi:CmpA/NrtA family ABC transporter substrate-binding protein [Atopomonas sediminilitoris]|uniref:CmpA/NrtA family ABC transporter substrate-binding protein n=1 Tax=Atopomonas sediminilitoris TaxID=2919919 RepID=UPI001F4EF440|nr:CmpA/NrtA family ABC transporter substrate-binding protein [Atopomonas sediminilitoris]MCJ8168837.1 ABC transporter substrate-binding protein [Atopomonas sediminilitoris]